MPYDPSLPLPNSPLESQVIRDQLQALFNLINNIVTVTAAQVGSTNTLPPGSPANVNVSVSGGTLNFSFDIPQGQEGLVGPAGPPFANAVVDGVSTLNPGDPATVGVSYDGSNVRFTFGIPRGSDGVNGTNGSDGSQGPPGNPGNDGAPGPQGPPFAQAVVDGVTTLNPGDPATVQTSFDGSNVRFTFGIPRGNDGMNGAQGPPGEVSQTDLNNGLLNTLNQCSNVSNGVSTITNGYTDPEAEELRQKVNELIAALRR
jgi:hypothetical protein